MALAVDSRQQQPQFSAMHYEPLRFAASHQQPAPQQPQFSNPWASAQTHAASPMYASSSLPPTAVGNDSHRYGAHTSGAAHAYSGAQLSASTLGTGILPVDTDLFDQSGSQFTQDNMNATRSFGGSYVTTAAPAAATYASTAAPQYAYGYQSDRRASHPSVASNLFLGDGIEEQKYRQSSLIDFADRFSSASEAERQSFSDALDASRGMVAMSQSDITPRNIYGTQASNRNSSDSYGFPSSHSTHSSISSSSTYPHYYNSSVSEASVGDYSSASESIDVPSSRTLPRPNGLLGGNLPPAPQSMMGQFSSKVSSSSQKKHKCKICDKRFTRPSSLQTHMYSHTGEKPFACDVEGCGRHFSVVSNLRRHRKVHKGEGRDPSSPDDDDD